MVLQVVANSGVIVFGTTDCKVIRWNYEEDVSEEIELSRRPEDAVHQLFLYPTGSHLFICLKNGDNFYLHKRTPRPKKLARLQGIIVESIAFDGHQTTEANTKSFLVGTDNGAIYEVALDSTGKEKHCNLVYQLDEHIPVSAMHFEITAGATEAENRLFVLLATSRPTRLYHFLGGPSFQAMFQEYKDSGTTSFQEVPFLIRPF